MSADRIHELLPWFLTRTLSPEEDQLFERHLPGCRACQRERQILEKLQAELDAHGEALLSEHPSPEDLVALFAPGQERPGEDARAAVRRHLALCTTCAEESRWVAGEAIAGDAGGGPSRTMAAGGAPGAIDAAKGGPRFSRWTTTLAAAAMGAAAGILAWTMIGPGRLAPILPATEAPASAVLSPMRRKDTTLPEVQVRAGSGFFHLLTPIDLKFFGVPVTIEIADAHGRSVQRMEIRGPEDLLDGDVLILDCPRDRYPDGEYVMRVSGRNARTPTETRFRVVTR